jgi:hypothetical protein
VSKPLHNVVLIGRAGLDPDADVIGAHQLTIEAGITYRQLDFWTRCGHLTTVKKPTPGSGRPRVYPVDQVPLAREMGRLIRAGIVTTPMTLVRETAVQILATGHAQVGDFTITHHEESA